MVEKGCERERVIRVKLFLKIVVGHGIEDKKYGVIGAGISVDIVAEVAVGPASKKL